jgi:hypothetical protein
MRRAALIATILAAAAFLWMLESPAPRIHLPPAAERSDASPAAATLSATPASEPGPGEPQREEIAEPPPPAAPVVSCRIGCRGRLAWRDNDAPIAGVTVKLRTGWRNATSLLPAARAPGEQDPDEMIAAVAARTDAAGRFELPELELPCDVFLWIDPAGPLEELHKVGFSLWPGAVLELGTLWLERRGGIAGRLVNARGEGVAGARVRAFDTALDPVVLDGDRRERLLAGAKEIGRGRLWLDDQGLGALPTWVIERDERLPFPETTTDRDGAFVLPSVRPGSVRLVAQAEGKRDTVRESQVRSGVVTQVGDIAIPSGRRWHVTVLQEGAPALGIEITGCEHRGPDTPFLALRAPIRTGPTGEADLGELASEWPACMLRRKPGWPWEVYDLGPGVDLEEPPGGTVKLPFARPPAPEIQSATVELHELMRAQWIVTDRDERLLDNATVELFSTQTSFGMSPARLPHELQPKQGADGIWVAMLPTSNVRVVARAPGYLAFTTIGWWSGSTELPLELTLTRCFALHVAVVDPQRAPVSGALVLARSPGIEEHVEPRGRFDWRLGLRDGFVLGVTGPDGLLRCDGMVEGRLAIAAMHPRFAFSPADPLFAAPDITVTVRMQRGGTVQGFVTENGVAPTERRLVAARPGSDLLARWRDHELLKPREVTTGPDGSYELTGLCEGEWRLSTKLPGAPDPERTSRPAPAHEEPVWVSSGATLRLDLELESDREQARFRGRITVDGAPRPGAVVRVSVRAKDRRSKPWEGHETTDSEGGFAFTSIPSGTGFIEVLARDGEAMQVLARREIEPKQKASLDFALQTNAIQAHVVTAEGRALAGREVAVAQTDGGAVFTVVTDPAGQIDIAALPIGVYRLRWTDDRGTERASQPFAVRPRELCVYELIVE